MVVTVDDYKRLNRLYDRVKSERSLNDDDLALIKHQVGNKLNPLAAYVSNAMTREELKFDPDATYKTSMATLKNMINEAPLITFELTDVIKKVVDEYKKDFREKAIPVDKVFETSNTYLARGNEIHVHDTISNFLANVIRHGKFDPTVQNHIDLSIEDDDASQRFLVSVADYGMKPALKIASTPEKSRELIFKKGYGTHEDSQGDAMYVFRKNLRKFGGDIFVDYTFPTIENEGWGTKFTAAIPYANLKN
jgi:signal transduction histidine kinase